MNYKIKLLMFLTFSLFSCSQNQDIEFNSESWKNAGGENILLDYNMSDIF